ncbi:FecR family protein [Sphingobacterium haloxyli]|uniref:Iron dicitrate transport regulator FecR n=1 Tax=Sphingobacterium haloxyli TaxID=2100533 RepID=A0A2S9J1F1_9SPHI|nr:FecR family protein [Sphingobacterium haloxyli]PRD46611.1 iron dicitrate transport regulator FecR [Sphingobacterium haloxyli]
MTEKEIHALLEKYITGECSQEEMDFLERWYANELQKRISESNQEDLRTVKDDLWKRIVDERPQIAKRRIAWRIWASAAAVLLIGFFVIYQSRQTPFSGEVSEEKIVNRTQNVLPGGNKAILTTGDGKQIVLTDEADGVIEEGEGFIIRKQEDGLVSFEITDHKSNATLINNTIETPKGGIYQVVLPDGSKAWLNSASSISFPVNFSAVERKVSIKGEVYFEIQHDPTRPFRVDAPQQQVEVLGTKFNINAYEDERYVRTSLVEGSVKVKGATQEYLLKPGFELSTTKSGRDKIGKADIKAIMAWKEGVFRFDRVELEVLMRQLARWYDVDVVYQGAYAKDEFVGEIKRNEDIRKVLSVLRYGNIDLSLEGRKLMVGQKTKIMGDK